MAPTVWKNELKAINFLRCEQGDPWAAALRIVQNAKFRRKIFGEDHWLLPLRLDGGAMYPEDFTLLRKGAFVLRTPPNERQVLVVDNCRYQSEIGLSRQRATFYITLTGLNDFTRSEGLDVVAIINGKGINMHPENGRLFQVTHYASGFKLNRVFLVRDPTDVHHTLSHLFEKLLLRMVKRF